MDDARRFTGGVVAAVLVAGGTLGCGSDREVVRCMSSVTGVSSPAPGVLTLSGNFYSNESIIVRDERTNTQVASGTPATNRTSFSFTGITPGIHTFEIIASCDNGQEDVAGETVTIQ